MCAVLGTEYVISLSAYNKAGDGQPIYETVTTREETGELLILLVQLMTGSGLK